MAPTINAVKQDILKLNSKIIYSDTPSFDFKEIDTSRLEAEIKNPNRNVVRMLLKTLAYEEQDDLLPSRWEIEHIFPQNGKQIIFQIYQKKLLRIKLNILEINYRLKKSLTLSLEMDILERRKHYIKLLRL